MNTSASGPATSAFRQRWTVSDIVVASTLAVASGVIFWGWNLSYHAVSTLFTAYPPAASLVAGMWLFPAVLGAVIIRKPGAAIYCEMVAAAVSALLGSQWGLGVLLSGFVQGLGAELIILAFLYRRFTVDVAILAGAAAGLMGGINENFIAAYYQYSAVGTAVHIGGFAVSGAIIAGLLPWLAARGLAATGVLGPLKSRRAHQESALGGRVRGTSPA